MHVQFATQNYLQTYGHPEHYPMANEFKKILTELDEITQSGKIRPIFNLQPALDLISNWETELSADTPENTAFIEHIRKEMVRIRRNPSYLMKFHPRLIRLMCSSRVFVYSDLLPDTPFRNSSKKFSEFLPAED